MQTKVKLKFWTIFYFSWFSVSGRVRNFLSPLIDVPPFFGGIQVLSNFKKACAFQTWHSFSIFFSFIETRQLSVSAKKCRNVRMNRSSKLNRFNVVELIEATWLLFTDLSSQRATNHSLIFRNKKTNTFSNLEKPLANLTNIFTISH